ncbi:MAG: tetratricopeptide repeat protein [Deltaproteobacteria bacterium]|nr:tetratricopeptide repeat protein [Deltaproteobacteria bacterium]
MAEKKTRKQLLKKDDAFLATANRSFKWMRNHRLAVIIPILLVILAIVGVWIGIEFLNSQRLEVSKLYKQAIEIKDAAIAENAEKADPTATPPTFASKEDRAQSARSAFIKVVDNFGTSGVAQMARFYIADLDIELGEQDKALNILQTLVNSLTPNDNLYFLAIERSAYLLEQKGDIDGALKIWQHLTGTSKHFYADHALFQLARLHAEKNEIKEARNLLARIEKEYPNSSFSTKVQELYAKIGHPETADASLEEGKKTVEETKTEP